MEHYKFQESALLGIPLQNEFQYIIGGGIAGLLLGYFLKRKGIPFKIYEKESRVGGLLDSFWCESGLVEKAANGFLWNQSMQDLADHLDLEIIGPSPRAKSRFLVANNKLKRFPLNIFDISRASVKMMWPSKKRPKTIKEFGYEFFGEKVAHKVLEPALMGIYGSRLEELSFPAVLPSFAKALDGSKSLAFGFWRKRRAESQAKNKKPAGTHAFKNGLGELVQALAEYLSEEIEYASPQKSISPSDSTIVTTPSYVAAKLCTNSRVASLLSEVKYVSMLSCAVLAKKADFPKLQDGFGCLIPRSEGYQLLGVLFNHCIFENRAKDSELVNLTCMFRDFDGSLLNASDDEIQDLLSEELKRLLGFEGAFQEIFVHRWKEAIPIYSPQLYENRFEIHEELNKEKSNLRLFGNYTGQVSIRGMCEEADKLVAAIPPKA